MPSSTRDWFWTGLGAPLIWSLATNPGGCRCLLPLAVIAVAVMVAVVVALIAQYWWVTFADRALLAFWLFPRYRETHR